MIECDFKTRDFTAEMITCHALIQKAAYSRLTRLAALLVSIGYAMVVTLAPAAVLATLPKLLLPVALVGQAELVITVLPFAGVLLGYVVFSRTWPRVSQWLGRFNRLPDVSDGEACKIRVDDTGLFIESEDATAWLGWKALDAVLLVSDRMFVVAAKTGRFVPLPEGEGGERERMTELVFSRLSPQATALSKKLQRELVS